jgi:hypothetical protein
MQQPNTDTHTYVVVIIIIIIIGRAARFVYFWLFNLWSGPVFTSLDFAPIIALRSKVVSLASNPQPGGPGLCIYVPQ